MRGGRALAAAGLAILLTGVMAPGTAAPQEQPGLRIVRPEDGSVVAGPRLAIALSIRGVVLGGRSRNGAFVLLELDELPPMKSYAERFEFRGVEDGLHVLVAELRRPDGSAFEPPVRETVRFEVSAHAHGAPLVMR